MRKTTNQGQDKGKESLNNNELGGVKKNVVDPRHVLDNELMWGIEDSLEGFSDLELHTIDEPRYKLKVTYKVKGEPKEIYLRDPKHLIVAFLYFWKLENPR